MRQPMKWLTGRTPKISLAAVGLFGIVLLGAGLRTYKLGDESLWNDELESWRESSFGSLGEVLEQGVLPDTHPPAFQVILYGVEHWWGDSEAQLRFPSAISGIISILLVYMIGRRFFGTQEGLIAALFMSVMWAPVSYSQEARNYALVTLLSLVASCFWIEIATTMSADQPVKAGSWIGFALGGTASAYTHYFGLLLFVLQTAVLLAMAAFRRRYLFQALASFGGFLLVFAPWIPSMVEQSTHTDRISWIQPPNWRAFPAFISFAFNGEIWLALLVIALLVWLGWTMLALGRRMDARSPWRLLGSVESLVWFWLAAPVVVSYAISIIWTPVFTQRNLLMCVPAVYLLAARGIGNLPISRLGQTALALGIAGVGLYSLVYSMGYYRFDQKEQFRETARYAIEQCPISADTAVIGYARFPDYFDYYFQRLNSTLRIELTAGEDQDVSRLAAYIQAKQPQRICFVSGHRAPDTGFLEALQRGYVVLDERSFFMAEFRLLKRAGS